LVEAKPFIEFQRNYRLEKKLGEGSFGVVNLCTTKGGEQFAVKEINIIGISPYQMGLVNAELSVMQKINYHYLLYAKEIYKSNDKIAIVTEYAENGKMPSNLLIFVFYEVGFCFESFGCVCVCFF
jgi:serine/threonine protein kinase